jgi:hypothetical protein
LGCGGPVNQHSLSAYHLPLQLCRCEHAILAKLELPLYLVLLWCCHHMILSCVQPAIITSS